MKPGQIARFVFVVFIAVVLQGCGESNALPDKDAKAPPPAEAPKTWTLRSRKGREA